MGGRAEYTLCARLDVGVRYVHRNIGRVLEDVQPYPIVAMSLGVPGAATANYLLTNPGPAHTSDPGHPGATISFESPVHDYNAVEFTANKRLANNWSLISSYRWSRLTGNFEGFFRNDNGQSDPGISSLYDYPTNDPTYATIGAAAVRLQRRHSLPRLRGATDRCRSIARTTSSCMAPMRSAWAEPRRVGLEVESGAPLTAFAAHPVYDRRRRDSADRRAAPASRRPTASGPARRGRSRSTQRHHTT